MNLDPLVQAAIISAIFGLGSIGATYLVMRRVNVTQAQHNEFSAAGELSDSAIRLVKAQDERISALVKQLTEMSKGLKQANQRIAELTAEQEHNRSRIAELEATVTILVGQIREAGLTPRVMPGRHSVE